MAEYAVAYRKRLQDLRRRLNGVDNERINRKVDRADVEDAATDWFAVQASQLAADGVASDILDKYEPAFRELLRLSDGSGNRKSSYLSQLDAILKNFREDFVVPLQTRRPVAKSLVEDVLSDLGDPEESDYLREATAAASAGLFRAAAVLGWCAAIDRIHRRIGAIGFIAFNVKSAEMASVTKGRYKRFSSPQNVHSLAEIREVFDTVILWVIEGMGLIDNNEHTRLKSCFDLRSQCAHPGNAPITEYNLLSFFSDLNAIVFQNAMFRVDLLPEDG